MGIYRSKIVFAAGGTGGHLIPAQRIAKQLQARSDMEIVFGGYKLAQSPYFDRVLFRFAEIASSSSLKKPFALLKGVLQAFQFLRKEKPDLVVGFGSYHAAPVLIAAALLGKKIFLYEANLTMGKVNRWMAPFAAQIGHLFPISHIANQKFVRVFVSPWDQEGHVKKEAKKHYALNPEKFTILVFGGSQGAHFFNEIMPRVAHRLRNVQMIHCTGSESTVATVKNAYDQIPAAVIAFEKNMQRAYLAADFVVCRSGAGTILELIYCKVPSLLIPYPYATDAHQQKNALYLSMLGGCTVLAQCEASVEAIVQRIENASMDTMRQALHEAAKHNEECLTFPNWILQYVQ